MKLRRLESGSMINKIKANIFCDKEKSITRIVLEIPNEIINSASCENEYLIKYKTLTPAEKNTLSLLALGKSNHEIASDLKISHQTVKGYLVEIYKKMGVSTRTAMVAYFKENENRPAINIEASFEKDTLPIGISCVRSSTR